jgi:hypothetical protein
LAGGRRQDSSVAPAGTLYAMPRDERPEIVGRLDSAQQTLSAGVSGE